jgi:hypothetical protein
MACNTNDGKCPSKKKKVLRWIGLATLTALAGVAIYDHRNQIASCAKKSAGWVKTKATGVAEVFTKKK